MKIRKWILSLVAAISMLGISACSSTNINEDAFSIYRDAYEKTSKMTSGNYTLQLFVDTENFEDIDLRGKLDFTGSYLVKDKQPQMSGKVNFSINGVKFSDKMNFYLLDNIMYMDLMGRKYKESLDTQENSDPLHSIDASPEGLKEQMQECVLEEKDGKKIVHIVLKKDFLGNILEASKDSLDSEYTEEQWNTVKNSLGTATVDLTIDEHGYVSDYAIDMKLEHDKQIVKINVTIGITAINEIEEITFPDFSEYIENDMLEEELEEYATGGGKLPSDSNYHDFGGEDL